MQKILVIEDDENISEIFNIALEDKYNIHICEQKSCLLSSLREFNPDLIILDNQVGSSSAEELNEIIRSEDKIVPVILCSANYDIISIAKKINANAYLSKPFDLNELYNCISDTLKQ